MDRELIIRLAEEAGLEPRLWNHTDAFERFAALVAAEKDKEIKMLAKALKAEQKKNKELISVMSGSVEIAVRLAVKAEREACAKVCDEIDRRWINQADKCAAAIRSRT